ncbi:putative conserved secreted protein [Synechococcus sp. BOUM118]|nr:putative conserved secreted protein [Synechococcus sp. BOUM118]
MPQDTRFALFLLAELVAALQANDPDTFKRWLYGRVHSLWKLCHPQYIFKTLLSIFWIHEA